MSYWSTPVHYPTFGSPYSYGGYDAYAPAYGGFPRRLSVDASTAAAPSSLAMYRKARKEEDNSMRRYLSTVEADKANFRKTMAEQRVGELRAEMERLHNQMKATEKALNDAEEELAKEEKEAEQANKNKEKAFKDESSGSESGSESGSGDEKKEKKQKKEKKEKKEKKDKEDEKDGDKKEKKDNAFIPNAIESKLEEKTGKDF